MGKILEAGVGGSNTLAGEAGFIRGAKRARRRVEGHKVGYVYGGGLGEGLVSEGEKLELGSEGKWKPMKFSEEGGGNSSTFGKEDEPSSSIEDRLEWRKMRNRETREEKVAIVQSGDDQEMDKNFGCILGEKGSDFGDVFSVKAV